MDARKGGEPLSSVSISRYLRRRYFDNNLARIHVAVLERKDRSPRLTPVMVTVPELSVAVATPGLLEVTPTAPTLRVRVTVAVEPTATVVSAAEGVISVEWGSHPPYSSNTTLPERVDALLPVIPLFPSICGVPQKKNEFAALGYLYSHQQRKPLAFFVSASATRVFQSTIPSSEWFMVNC